MYLLGDSMSLGQIGMCGRPFGALLFPPIFGRFRPAMPEHSRRLASWNLAPVGTTNADQGEMLALQLAVEDSVERCLHAHRHSCRLSPNFPIAEPGIRSRKALPSSSIQPKHAWLAVAYPADTSNCVICPGVETQHEPEPWPLLMFSVWVAAMHTLQDRFSCMSERLCRFISIPLRRRCRSPFDNWTLANCLVS